VSRRAGDRQSAPHPGRRFAQAWAAIRYDLSWRFARPGAFRQRFEQAIANMPQGICLYDAQDRLQLVNEQFCRIYNQPMSRLHTGMKLYDVLADSCAIGNYPDRDVAEIYLARKRFIDRREKGTFLQELGDGRLIAIYHQPLPDGGWVCTYEDITERRRAEARVEFLAHHDGLTELPNRVLFTERLDHAISQASIDDPCALLCLDLDGFKGVNDRFGHAAGDLLLQTVARRLRDCVRSDDTCARLGGDEFAVVLPNVSPDVALRIAHQITATLGTTYDLGTFGSAEIGSSIGIAYAPEHAASSDQLLLVADRALYISKKAKLGVAVEGVETAEHRELLAELSCDLLQGFLLARPQAPEQLRSSLAPDLPFHEGASIVPTTATNEPDKDQVASRNLVAQPTQVGGRDT
jgi:diguanylate cyclase (GGDEF)-like protein